VRKVGLELKLAQVASLARRDTSRGLLNEVALAARCLPRYNFN
jgi:hypothetical protein